MDFLREGLECFDVLSIVEGEGCDYFSAEKNVEIFNSDGMWNSKQKGLILGGKLPLTKRVKVVLHQEIEKELFGKSVVFSPSTVDVTKGEVSVMREIFFEGGPGRQEFEAWVDKIGLREKNFVEKDNGFEIVVDDGDDVVEVMIRVNRLELFMGVVRDGVVNARGDALESANLLSSGFVFTEEKGGFARGRGPWANRKRWWRR
ncbi:hypothetical protein BD414DRAFT_508406 [Trametes punicea]|nr:hypothetical protein BD414DRAFT_508406 [Trametes punicea]